MAKIPGYEFKNNSLLENALTHSSYANEKKGDCRSNERLEFLGDSILSLVVSEYLYSKFDNFPEGKLSKTRAGIVCEDSLARCANDIHLGDMLYLGHGEEHTGGRQRASILADAYEALIAAIFLDSDYQTVKKWLLPRLQELIHSFQETGILDYKTQLQEILQKEGKRVEYEIVKTQGPDHNRIFTVEARVDDQRYLGTGKSKKEAEQDAACHLLKERGILK